MTIREVNEQWKSNQNDGMNSQPRKEISVKKSIAKKLSFTALFAALCCVGTLVIVIPLPYGYFNAGDIFVLLASWCLGPVFGSVAAAIGSSLADVLSGFLLYAPVTFVVKDVDALIAYFVWFIVKKFLFKGSADIAARIVSAVVAEAWMVLGYFAFESILYGIAGGAVSLAGNALQGGFAVVCGSVLIACLYKITPVRGFFPCLGRVKHL